MMHLLHLGHQTWYSFDTSTLGTDNETPLDSIHWEILKVTDPLMMPAQEEWIFLPME